ncbi:DUF368 domain-containing protein [Nocardioides limicola]|uniref:DUF368 domain-containing protein n=1 Tax=Nocardioides limicola TaxID=2803368 RepID=UPI00193B13AA|nr:DUF368 domain-containing protein [Nocardioides sp. DJM-14]
MSSRPLPARALRRPARLLPLDLIRGFLIGCAELVPGVSGGTVALVTGVYEQLIASASHLIDAARRLLFGHPDGRLRGGVAELRRTDWMLVLPVMAGMGTALLVAAGVVSGFVTEHPEHARGLFLGLVAASVLVPIGMLTGPRVRGSRLVEVLIVIGAAALAWTLIGMAGGGEIEEPSRVLLVAAAAVAICALVIPGVSGSFFLLAIGLYAPTLTAIAERDLGYLTVFAAGAALGLVSFVQVLRWLLVRHRRVTLVVMTGLMIGSLRALWPWQQRIDHGAGALVAPYSPVAGPLLLALLGVACVLTLIAVERGLHRRHPQHPHP